MVPLLQRLERKEYEMIINCSKQLDVKKGTTIYSEGDLATQLYFIKQGKVKCYKKIEKDQEIILFIRGELDCFGELGVFSGSTYSNAAIAIEKTSLYVMDKDVIEKIVADNGTMGLHFTRWLSQSLQTSEAKLRDYIVFGSEGAVAAVFIRYSNMYGVVKQDGIRITEPILIREVSKHIGISRETVSRVVNKWKQDGIIASDNKYFLIKDISYMQKLLSCEQCSVENCVL
ncbi:transcriptional regulator, Crp/Fnr family [Oceanobacillus limi]|uniref:Transcriptional regulator, Crp/Fnr family n=1 Tax=Oceanobacillus limi TaxID=930131 RepID=A0A1H9YFZ4_9BACI|nr:Crp/Fnr family transcriptional regulator [Oceanobacillus limi]SES67851.1 transcriptional regulator, Crp/Fnr family [Oceanobacillus limi]